MQFGLASPIVGLYEKSSAFTVGNDASEPCLKAGSATGDDDGADFAGHLQTLISMTLGCFYFLWVEVKVLHGSVSVLEHATFSLFHTRLPPDQKAR